MANYTENEFDNNLRLLEALLFASREPISLDTISDCLSVDADAESLIEQLARLYENRGINLLRVSNGWAFRTAPDLATDMTVFREVSRRLSRAALETLAIIAYHQPVTRAEIEEIRGVGLSRGTLDNLLEAGWVKPKGRRKTPGRPATWVTTPEFLNHFGLADVHDLPGVDELRAVGLIETDLDSKGILGPASFAEEEEIISNE